MSEELHRICSSCKVDKPVSQFYKDVRKSLGVSHKCKTCKNADIANLRLRRANTEKVIPEEKRCPRCETVKSCKEFSNSKVCKDGLYPYCKICAKAMIVARQTMNASNPIILDVSGTKTCITCNIEKPYTAFRINNKTADSISQSCTECLPKNNWTKEKQAASEKKYRMNNPEKIREKERRHAQNINRRVRNSLNKRIVESLSAHRNYKTNKTVIYLGCDIPYLRKWIEHLFKEGMTWGNYGQWHLDHVKPCASFDLTIDEEIKICFSWKNLQPLWAKDNQSKNDKIDTLMIQKHRELADTYEKENILS